MAKKNEADDKDMKDILDEVEADADAAIKEGAKSEDTEDGEVHGDDDKKVESVKKEDITIELNLDAEVAPLFESAPDLPEEFKATAKTIFEAVVKTKAKEIAEAKVAEIRTALELENAKIIGEQVDVIRSKLNDYLDLTAEEWMTKNAVAVESKIIAEHAGSFLSGLKSLFDDHYVDIPAEKVSMIEGLEERVKTLDSALKESTDAQIALRNEISMLRRDAIISEASVGLYDTDAEKLRSMAEEIDFVDADTFRGKVTTIKETYFKENRKSMNDDRTPLVQEKAEVPASDAEVSRLAEQMKIVMGR